MEDLQLKQKIHDFVDRADEQLLKLIHAMLKEYEKNSELIGVDPSNGVIRKDDLVERAIASNAAISEGRIKNIKQIREEFKNRK